MSTTTIRVDLETHARLVELGATRQEPLMQTVRDAVDALHREQFAHQVASELTPLRNDTDASTESSGCCSVTELERDAVLGGRP